MTQPTDDASLLFGQFTFRPRRRLLLEAGMPVRVGSRALDLLMALTERAGEVVSRNELVARIWPNTVVEETSLRVHASQLRKALRDGHDGARYIINVPGRGYAFVAEVIRAAADSQASSHISSTALIVRPASVSSIATLIASNA
jgi:DNA-binding winged helix-turn-helix (wHTH) protein